MGQPQGQVVRALQAQHAARGGGCPAFAIMERMPDDVATNILFRRGKCSQYEVKPKRPKKQKAADVAGR